MTPIIEDAVLGSDLDGQLYNLLNVGELIPVPSNLATSDDLRLNDMREPLPGSVVNASVAAAAAIDQSKINFNGPIPTAWLGATATTAAPGDQAEYVVNKNVPNGYCGLDSSGKISSAQLPTGAGLATVSSISMVMPAEFRFQGGNPSPITGSGTFDIRWNDIGAAAWFGRTSGTGVPSFQFGPLPSALIPNLSAVQVTSGVFTTARLPVAIGVGGSDAPGTVPDPGATGVATDYLARDMTYKTAPTIVVGYQTQLPAPTLNVSPATGIRTITPGYDPSVAANEPYQDAIFFYSRTSSTTGFAEFPHVGYVEVPAGTVWVYAAHTGYNNSTVVSNP